MNTSADEMGVFTPWPCCIKLIINGKLDFNDNFHLQNP